MVPKYKYKTRNSNYKISIRCDTGETKLSKGLEAKMGWVLAKKQKPSRRDSVSGAPRETAVEGGGE